MKTIAITLLAIPMALFSLSCNKNDGAAKTAESGNGSIAVVNLDNVAKAMGWNDEMKKNMTDTQNAVGGQLNAALFKPAAKALEDKRNEIAKAANLNAPQIKQLGEAKNKKDLEDLGLNTKQVEEMLQAMGNFVQVATQAKNILEQALQAQNIAIIRKCREAMLPSVRRVAIAEHKSAVVTPNDSLMYYESGVDISDKVIDDLQKNNASKVELPPIPVLNIQMPTAPAATTRPK